MIESMLLSNKRSFFWSSKTFDTPNWDFQKVIEDWILI